MKRKHRLLPLIFSILAFPLFTEVYAEVPSKNVQHPPVITRSIPNDESVKQNNPATGSESAQAESNRRRLPSSGQHTMQVEIADGQIDVISGIVYNQVRSKRSTDNLLMTLFTPRTPERKPCIVYFPGGGFMSADHEKFIEMRYALARAGFVVAAVEYRTIPDTFPAILQDGKAAVRFLRAHADEFGIDPDKIGTLGDSAGGYLSLMMGTTNGEKTYDVGDFTDSSSDVQASVSLYGISNLINIGEDFSPAVKQIHESPAVTEALLLNGTAFNTFSGANVQSDPEKALAASPVGHVKKGLPPFLLMNGTADRLVSPSQSEQMYHALKEKGNKATHIVLDGAGHGDLYWFQQPIIDLVVEWFKENLGTPLGVEGRGEALSAQRGSNT